MPWPRGKPRRHAQVCLYCGSEWFYECQFEWIPGMPCWVLICLCGMPQPPELGGIRGGRTPNIGVIHFFEDLVRIDRIAAVTVRKLPRAAWQPVREALARIEGMMDDRLRHKRLRRQAARIVPVSKRDPAGSGKDMIVVALQGRGLTFRKARQAVDAIISIWESNLIDHLPVETPLGWIGTPCGPRIRSRVCFEKVCVLFSENRRVRLTK